MAQAFTAGFVNVGSIGDHDQSIVSPSAYNELAEGGDRDDFDAFLEAAALVDSHIRGASELAPAIVAMLNRAHALGAGTLDGGRAAAERAVDAMDHYAIAPHCENGFLAVTGCNLEIVDECAIFSDPDTFQRTADGWTIEARVRLDTDCGESNPVVRIAGRTLPGLTEIVSVTRA